MGLEVIETKSKAIRDVAPSNNRKELETQPYLSKEGRSVVVDGRGKT